MYPGLDEGDLTELLNVMNTLIERVQTSQRTCGSRNGTFELGLALRNWYATSRWYSYQIFTDEANRQL